MSGLGASADCPAPITAGSGVSICEPLINGSPVSVIYSAARCGTTNYSLNDTVLRLGRGGRSGVRGGGGGVGNGQGGGGDWALEGWGGGRGDSENETWDHLNPPPWGRNNAEVVITLLR